MSESRPGIGEPGGVPHLAGVAVAGLYGVRLPDGTVGDVLVDGETVVGAGGAPGEGTALDATGWRVLPAACEPHAHLDKALTGARMDPAAGNDLLAAIAAWREMLPGIDAADIAARALAAIEQYVARGTTAIRSHVDVPLTGDPFRGVDALVAVREQLRGRVELQVCLLAGSEVDDGVLAEAVARGVDVVGGCPHLAPDPHREVTRMLDLAERHGLPIDLHCDEQTDITLPDDGFDLVDLARQAVARGMDAPGRVTGSHCVRLGVLPPERLGPVVALVAAARTGIVTLPITNLYLQGRGLTHSAPRALTAVRALLDAGVPLAAGGDNLRDPFNPVGRADPFETTSLLMTAGHLRGDEALAAVTSGARAVMGLPPAGTAPGERADLMLVPDVPPGDVLAGATDARVVLHGGRVVADTRTARALDLLPDPSRPALAR
ncbi:amidohydrolase family protein [Pseudonocardia lacus]|uniref:amidohydrolase family protein n=1 Tax=Pseudonocardia lacus TaxID=2835865 RepID=UPI001BDC18BD|nr:amidohydrolase family protein [Pseudonocardia lacus]